MEVSNNTIVTIETTVELPVDQTWNLWIDPEHITKWNTATEEWHSPRAENDVTDGGKFNIRMEAKDGSFGFDFSGTYTKVVEHHSIAYTLDDGRKVSVLFQENNGQTHITEKFEAESQNPVEMQRNGWQAILNNFKKYAENQNH